MRAAMNRHERFRFELAAGFEAEKKKANLDWRSALERLDRQRDASLAEHDRRHWELHRAIEDLEESVLSCRSREAAATARVSLLRELASVGNPAGQDVAPSYSRGQDTPLEPAQPDFATHALKETNKSEPTFGLHGEMDEFRRLKVMYPTASTRELAEFQVQLSQGPQGLSRAPPRWPTFCWTQVTRTKQMVRDAFARAEADERSGQPGRQVLEGILRALCLGLSPSTPHQALQQLQTFQVPEKTSFADFLSELRIAVMNVKDVVLVPPDDSTMQVAVKASIDDQFATLAASIFAGRNRSAVPFGSVDELLDSLGDLTMNRTPATAATRLGPRKAGGGAASGSARSGNVFPVGGKEKKSRLDDAWYWKHDEMEYEHILAVLDKEGGFGQNRSDPAFYVRFPTLEERRAAREKFAKKCLNCGEDAHFARVCPHPFLNV
ncbi:unnamed protein product, partial [Ascophyllum nodosum]